MAEAEHTSALRKAFPGVWIREDGAFQHDTTGIRWMPGDVERQDDWEHSMFDQGGLCYVGGPPSSGRGAMLKLSQLSALTDYIATENRRAKRSPEERGE